MKYFSVETVVNAYKGFQECMTNKSWGYLALLKGCKNCIRPSVPYEVDLDVVSNFLENIFNLSQTKKSYNSARSLYVVFSNKWDNYFKDQGKYSPDIYDVIVWAYRRKSFADNITNEDVVAMFAKEFNIPSSIISNSFNTKVKSLSFSSSLYSEAQLKSELSRIGVDVTRNNIDAKKGGFVAAPGEISRGPFVQPLYAALEITDYVIIMQSDYTLLYGNSISETPSNETALKDSSYRPYITAIKSKPFLLLAGISGTGKSRIVRELARACWEEGSEEFKALKPRNFEMVQVKPNWHDSSELIGYVSRIDGVRYVVGPFLRFMVKAIRDPNTPYFLCLDEMNLAPVEQYFAEYLSVVESRKRQDDGSITTDPIIDYSNTEEYKSLIDQLFSDDEELRKEYLTVIQCPDDVINGFDGRYIAPLAGVDPVMVPNGWLYTIYKRDNSHVNKTEYRLGDDVYGYALLDIGGELVLMSNDMTSISMLDNAAMMSVYAPYLKVVGRYLIETPVFHTLCHTHGALFEDLIEPAH